MVVQNVNMVLKSCNLFLTVFYTSREVNFLRPAIEKGRPRERVYRENQRETKSWERKAGKQNLGKFLISTNQS